MEKIRAYVEDILSQNTLLADHGEKISFERAMARFLVNLFNLVLFMSAFLAFYRNLNTEFGLIPFNPIQELLIFSLPFLMFFFNDKRQCLHDFITGCYVVKREAEVVEKKPDIIQHLVD